MGSVIKILLAEDDLNLGYILKEYLEMHDFSISWCKDGDEAWKTYQQQNFDIAVLDVMMPKRDGFMLAADIKQLNPDFPIVFLTAKALKVDKLKGFRIGCDDYIIKPVEEEELIARINAIVRRSQRNSTTLEDKGSYAIGQYVFDYKNQALYWHDQKIQMTEKETEILKLLSERKGQLLDRRLCLQKLWGENDYFNRRSMDVFITKLRKYLSHDESVKIINVHGKGFILDDHQASQ
ncbi:MAG: response regulator transcription factor [Bacteroidota bacterium]